MLVDNQQLISFHVFTRSWASVCVSYFFVPVETGAPPFEETISLYKGVVSGCQCETLIRPVGEISRREGALLYNSSRFGGKRSDGVENASLGQGSGSHIAIARG